MPSFLDNTYGSWLVALFLANILYGIALLQVYLYFLWYPKDSWYIKLIVITLTILETMQITLFFQLTYNYLITNFGDHTALFVLAWSNGAQLAAGYLSAFVVQMYFGYTIYQLRRSKLVSFTVWIIALSAVTSGLAQTVISSRLRTLDRLGETWPISTMQSSCTVACDVLITVALCWDLNEMKIGVKRADQTLNFLMAIIVNRGALTAVAAILNLVLFITLPGTFWFCIGLTPGSKLYMNSLLATLNARQRAQTHLDQSMSLSSFHVENADAARRSTVVTLDPRGYSANTGTSNSSMSKCEDEEAHRTPSTTLGRKTGRGLGDLVFKKSTLQSSITSGIGP